MREYRGYLASPLDLIAEIKRKDQKPLINKWAFQCAQGEAFPFIVAECLAKRMLPVFGGPDARCVLMSF